MAGEIDAVLTFPELRKMIAGTKYAMELAEPSEFDPPYGAAGRCSPWAAEMLQAANIHEDLMTGEVVSTQGRTHTLEAVKEFADGQLGAKLLERFVAKGVCDGGGGRQRFAPVCPPADGAAVRQSPHGRHRPVALARGYGADVRPGPLPDLRPQRSADLHAGLRGTGRDHAADGQVRAEGRAELRGPAGYDTCREHAIAIWKGLAENEMCLPHTIDQLRKVVKELEGANGQLASAQEALVQSEKLASMGQLAAGIAHEVNNPLGVVLMYCTCSWTIRRRDRPCGRTWQ